MDNPSTAAESQRSKPDLGLLAARLLVAVQDELYARLQGTGFEDVTRLHGAVIAYLDEGGTRATELARRSGRHKQVVGRIVDELEELGYVERCPEPGDRRAKLVVPTERGREMMRVSDEIIAHIERRQAQALGEASYDRFKRSLREVVASLTQAADGADRQAG
jgi:DNA-binding MarR family transcriptional regulator